MENEDNKDQYCLNGGKKRYASRAKAQEMRNQLDRKRRAKNLKVYQCPHCHDWHLTSHNFKVR